MTIVTMIFIHAYSCLFSFSVMQQQTSVYPNMMPNQQQNVYNQVGGNPTLSRTASQTPLPMSNQQWSSNQPMSVSRTPQQQQQQQQHGYNQVWIESMSDTNTHLRASLDDATGSSTTAAAALCHSTAATTTTTLLIHSWRSNGLLLFFFFVCLVVISVRYNCFCSPPSIDEQHLF